MSTISGIQSSGDIFAPSRARPYTAARTEPTPGRYSGPDTVTLSEEARQLAQGAAAATHEATEARPGREKIARADTGADSSLKVNRKSIFALLMESLLLAEMEESGAGGDTGQNAAQTGGETAPPAQKSASPLQDGEKVARFKQVVNDFMTGKADLADLPRAMSVGKSSAGRGAAAPTGVHKGGETADEII